MPQGVAPLHFGDQPQCLAGQPARPRGRDFEQPGGFGSTASGIDISGPITIDRAEIRRLAAIADFPTIEVREINKPAPPPSAQPAARRPPAPTATPIRLGWRSGRRRRYSCADAALDAEMSGDPQVGGSPAAPTVVGGLDHAARRVRSGWSAAHLRRGVVTLDNLDQVDPRLDFVASTSVQSTTINVAIGGTARAAINVTSIPSCRRTRRWPCCCSASRPRTSVPSSCWHRRLKASPSGRAGRRGRAFSAVCVAVSGSTGCRSARPAAAPIRR